MGERIHIGNTWKGENGTFTGVRYLRNAEWFGGVWDRQTDKRTYGIGLRTARDAAEVAEHVTKKAAGKNAVMQLKEKDN